MKQLDLIKDVQLDTSYDELQEIDIQCQCTYSEEKDGIQVNGVLNIEGSASQNHVKKTFHEQVILDLFVTREKLDGNTFEVRLLNYQANLNQNLLSLELQFEINGMSDEVMKSSDDNTFDDLFENEDDTYVNSVMVVVKELDTYASIAHQYHIKEADLRDYNQNKPLEAKMLIRIPMVNQN